MDKIYHIGSCPICHEYGQLEIYKNLNNNKLFIICEECLAEWSSPQDIINGVKGKRQSRNNGKVIVATIDEIKDLGWDKYIVEE